MCSVGSVGVRPLSLATIHSRRVFYDVFLVSHGREKVWDGVGLTGIYQAVHVVETG